MIFIVLVHFSYVEKLVFNGIMFPGPPGFLFINVLSSADVTEPLLVEVDRIYHLACPASPIFYKYNPVKVSRYGSLLTLSF